MILALITVARRPLVGKETGRNDRSALSSRFDFGRVNVSKLCETQA
jgi:hypothetical protein